MYVFLFYWNVSKAYGEGDHFKREASEHVQTGGCGCGFISIHITLTLYPWPLTFSGVRSIPGWKPWSSSVLLSGSCHIKWRGWSKLVLDVSSANMWFMLSCTCFGFVYSGRSVGCSLSVKFFSCPFILRMAWLWWRPERWRCVFRVLSHCRFNWFCGLHNCMDIATIIPIFLTLLLVVAWHLVVSLMPPTVSCGVVNHTKGQLHCGYRHNCVLERVEPY